MLFSGFSDDDHTVARLRPSLGSDRGEPFLDHSRPTREEVESADVQPAAGTQFVGPGRDATEFAFVVLDYSSPRGFWQESDRVEIDGVSHNIEGPPQEYGSPTGGLAHTALLVNRTEG